MKWHTYCHEGYNHNWLDTVVKLHDIFYNRIRSTARNGAKRKTIIVPFFIIDNALNIGFCTAPIYPFHPSSFHCNLGPKYIDRFRRERGTQWCIIVPRRMSTERMGEADFCHRECMGFCTVNCMHSIPVHLSSQSRT